MRHFGFKASEPQCVTDVKNELYRDEGRKRMRQIWARLVWARSRSCAFNAARNRGVNSLRRWANSLLVALGAIASASAAFADEGMWTFDHFPSAKVQKLYGQSPDAAWLTHVQKAAVRLPGCSASFVSKDGLILTNWHCVANCLDNLSSPEHNYSSQGLQAKSREEERKCVGFRAQTLLSITDVTARVQAATRDAPAEQFTKLRNGTISIIETEACAGPQGSPKYDCNVISLYQGGQYHLYRYRNYTDVRLVFAPENAVGFFGGDPDNFNFPRFNLDSAFLRAYEDGKPASTPDFLAWSGTAPKAGDLVYVAGNPGSTQRLASVAQLALRRDRILPVQQLIRSELRGRLENYAGQSDEARRQAQEVLFGLENSFKSSYGQAQALADPQFFGALVAAERELSQKVAQRPELVAEIGDPWAEIEAATALQRNLFLEADFLENRPGSISSLYAWARTLVRAAAERQKPNSERQPRFTDQRLPGILRNLAEASPVYPELERMGLEIWLARTREYLGADHATTRLLLGRESPEARAARLVAGTKLADPKVRTALWEGGQAAILASQDPLIVFVREHDEQARALGDRQRAQIEGPIARANENIARARFAIYGDTLYPDATFTLRLSFGRIEGWSENGAEVKPFTDFRGLYERANGAFPFALAPSWQQAKSKLDLDTPFNVVSSNDIIGGNSGSPLLNAKGEVIGAVFDGNIHSLGGAYGYDAGRNRSVSVLSVAIVAALRQVYGLDGLADEIAPATRAKVSKPQKARRAPAP